VLSQLSDRLNRMGGVISRGTPSGTPSAGPSGLAGATPPTTAPAPEPEPEPEPEPMMKKKRTPRKTPRKTPRHRSVSPEPDWVDALGTLEDPSKTPRAWEAEPVSVGVVRKHYRLRRQGEEAAARARVRRDNELKGKFRRSGARADGAMSSSSDDDEEASKPVVVDDPDITKLYGLAYGAVANDAGARGALVARVDAELRSGGAVLLVAHPDDNDGEAANCRLVLRTLHAACNPTLTDPIPPVPLARADGSVAMRLDPKRRREHAFPLPIPAPEGRGRLSVL
jgi:hypothetical protein